MSYALTNGLYVGAGYVTGQFENQTSSKGELSFNAGYGNELANGISYDINVARYLYSGSAGQNYNELTLTVGYGPFSAAYYKSFNTNGFVNPTGGLDLTYTHGFSEKVEGYVMLSKGQGNTKPGIELGVSYDLGNNLSASAVLVKDATPGLVLGLTKSF